MFQQGWCNVFFKLSICTILPLPTSKSAAMLPHFGQGRQVEKVFVGEVSEENWECIKDVILQSGFNSASQPYWTGNIL